MYYKFWPAYLPEAGRAMDRASRKMSDIRQKIDALGSQIHMLEIDLREIENDAERLALTAWSQKEIDEAKGSADKNANLDPAQSGPTFHP